MTRPVRTIEHTHNLTVMQRSLPLRDTTVGRVYPAEVNAFGGVMPDGAGYTRNPFISIVDDAGDVVVLKMCARGDIKLEPVACVPAPSVTVHEAGGVFRDCTPGKTYPAHLYFHGMIDAQGYPTVASRTLGFIDDAGDFVNQADGRGYATLNCGVIDV